MIERNNYLNKIKSYLGKPIIKVLTGMRRVGKSTLLLQLASEIKKIDNDFEMLNINMESLQFEFIKDYSDLYKYVKSSFANNDPKKRLLLIDEVQEIKSWEKAISSIYAENYADIIITGSNAHLLSSDLATLLSGRYIEIMVYPLLFSEFIKFKDEEYNLEITFKEFLKYGGLPAIHYFIDNEQSIYEYQNSIIDTILLKDIVKRYNIRDIGTLEKIFRYINDNIGNITSSKNISDYFKSQKIKISVDTILNYFKYLESAFIIYKVQRYDLKGKKHLEFNEKLYIGDIGLRNGIIGYKDQDISAILENIVYLELLARSYKVSIGVLGNNEIDFIAEKNNEKLYFQVTRSLSEQSTIDREFGNLKVIDDNYEKIVLSLEKYFEKDIDGIKHFYLPDWLLMK